MHDISLDFDVTSDLILMIGVFPALKCKDGMSNVVSESLPSGILKNPALAVGRTVILITPKHVRST